jgi:hypothetical protein
MMCACPQCVADRNSKFASIGQGLDIVNVQSVQQGLSPYRTFNRFGPSRVRTVDHLRVIPPIVVELGELVGLMYRSDKGRPGQPRTYIHQMEDRPRLVSNIEGTQLYIVGGSYQVTARGIEG